MKARLTIFLSLIGITAILFGLGFYHTGTLKFWSNCSHLNAYCNEDNIGLNLKKGLKCGYVAVTYKEDENKCKKMLKAMKQKPISEFLEF